MIAHLHSSGILNEDGRSSLSSDEVALAVSELASELVSDDESDEDEYDDVEEASNRGRFLVGIVYAIQENT